MTEEILHQGRKLALILRAGFRAEGTKRSGARHADGWHDMHLHARVESDGERDEDAPGWPG